LFLPKTLHRCQRGFDAERLHSIEHLTRDSTVNPHATKTDAAHFSPLAECATTCIPLRVVGAPTIVDLQLPAAPAAAEKTGKQRFATTDRAAPQIALSVGVVGDQVLIPFELLPSNIAFMVALDQNLPFAPIPAQASNHAFSAPFDGHPRAAPPKGIGPRVNGIRQHMMQRVVDGCLPF